MTTAAQKLRDGQAQWHRKAGVRSDYTPIDANVREAHLIGLALEDLEGYDFPTGVPGRGTYCYVTHADVGCPASGDLFSIKPDDDESLAGEWKVVEIDTDYIDAGRSRIQVSRIARFDPNAVTA